MKHIERKFFIKDYSLYKKLFESSSSLRFCIDVLPNIAIVVDSKGLVVKVNSYTQAILGYSSDEIEGKSFEKFVEESYRGPLKNMLESIRKDVKKFKGYMECSIIKKDGDTINLSCTETLFLENEAVKYLLVIGYDISNHRRLEKALTSTSKLLTQIIGANTMPSFVLDKNGNVIYWNKACEAITGMKASDIIGKDEVWTPFYEESRPVMANLMLGDVGEKVLKKWYPNIRKSSFAKGSYSAEGFFPKIGESGRWLQFTAVAIRDEDKEIIAAIETIQDITVRKKSELTLKEKEGKYRSLFENMAAGFAYHRMVYDEQGKPLDYVYLEINDEFESLTGFSREDIVGKTVTAAIPGTEEDSFDWIRVYGKVASTGESITIEDQYSESLDKWYSIVAYSPKKGYFATVFIDITERKRMEKKVIAAMKELKHSNMELTNLNNFMIGREVRMRELKNRIKDLESK